MLFGSFIACMDFCSASGISDCCRHSLQRAVFTWWKGNSVISVSVNHCSPAVGCVRDARGWPQPQGFREVSQTFFGGPISEGFAFLKHRGSFPPMILFPSHKRPGCLSPAECTSQHPFPNVPLTPESCRRLFPLPGPALALGLSHQARLVPPLPTPALGPGASKPSTISAGLLGRKIRDISKHCCVRSFLHGLQHSVELCFMLTTTFLNVFVVLGDWSCTKLVCNSQSLLFCYALYIY